MDKDLSVIAGVTGFIENFDEANWVLDHRQIADSIVCLLDIGELTPTRIKKFMEDESIARTTRLRLWGIFSSYQEIFAGHPDAITAALESFDPRAQRPPSNG